jgi:hypothetical protein
VAGFLSGLMEKLKGTPRAPAVHLGAFGKHPGWNDHMDNQGLETPQLLNLRRLLYVQGISGNIDSGAWEALAADQRLEQFHHLLLCRDSGSFLVARLWSSSDGKGRRKYPMVAVAQADNLPFGWLIDNSAALLQRLQHQAAAATDAATVISAFDSARANLRQAAPRTTPAAEAAPSPLAVLAKRQEMGQDLHALRILLYHLQREMGAFLVGARPGPKTASRHMRVPLCADSPEGALALWTAFLVSQIDPGVMFSVIVPLDQPWADLVVGEPAPAQLFCFRTTAKTTPLVTDIPYNLDPEFVAKVDLQIAQATA